MAKHFFVKGRLNRENWLTHPYRRGSRFPKLEPKVYKNIGTIQKMI
jgi:hypothetical protein